MSNLLTVTQLQTFEGITLDESDPLLVKASDQVRWLLRFASFDVDEIADTLAKAAAAQVAWAKRALNGDQSGASVAAGGGSIGQVSMPQVQTSGGVATTGEALVGPEVLRILQSDHRIHWQPGY
jgi:hypothetical protein